MLRRAPSSCWGASWMTSTALVSGCLSHLQRATGLDPTHGRPVAAEGGLGRGAGSHLLAHVRGDLVELLRELVVVELERVEIGAPAHGVLGDQRGLGDLV